MSDKECETGKQKVKRKRNKLVSSKVLKQLEFYFSDTNLHKDRFMKEKVLSSQSPTGNPVSISTLMTFNKVKTIGATPEIIKKCVKTSLVLGLGEDGASITRLLPIKEPTNVDGRTVYVENLAADSSHETLTEIFSHFGSVVYVSLPRFKRTKDIKGFAFIEFATEEGAKKACGAGCDVKSNGAVLPEVNTPAPLPKMNRAMAALAKEKAGATAETTMKTESENDLADEAVVKNSSSPTKRRRSASEGEERGEEDEGEGMKKKRKRRGRTRSISVGEEKASKYLDGDAVGEAQAALHGGKSAVTTTSSDDAKDGLPQETRKKLKRKKTVSESSDSATAEKKTKKTLEERSSGEEKKKKKRDAKEKKVAAVPAASNAEEVKNDAENEKNSVEEVKEGIDKSKTSEDRKKPKNRRKKVDKKTRLKKLVPPRPPTPKMSVMPKMEWLALRNEYLALQRQRMSALKQNLANSKTEQNGTEEAMNSPEMHRERPESSTNGRTDLNATEISNESILKKEERTYEKVLGLIIKVESKAEDNPLPPRSLLKSSFEKELISPTEEAKGSVKIAYMDMEEGQLTGHIRCENTESASRVLELGLSGFGVSLLAGKEEDDYWEKVRLCREARKKTTSKKSHRAKNGLKKLVEKASLGAANSTPAAAPKTHVRFDD